MDEEDVKVVGMPFPSRQRICFYPGPNPGAPPDFEDFLGALDHLGDCDTLIYSEVKRTKVETQQMVDWHRRNLQIQTQLGFINEIEMYEPPELRLNFFFNKTETEWIGTMPGEDRLWADYALLRIGPRYIHLLHLGIGGLAAWLWFFQPHGLKVARLVTNPVPR